MIVGKLQIGLVVKFGKRLRFHEWQPRAKEIIPMLKFVQISVHIAIEIALDVAWHDRFGIDKDTRTVDDTHPLAYQRAIHKYQGKIKTRIGQSDHSVQFVEQRL